MRSEIKYILFSILSMFVLSMDAQQIIDLSGRWDVKLDSLNQEGSIMLPGTTDDAGFGIANTLTPKMEKPQLLHLTRKHFFVGVATYSREIEIPKSMAGKSLELLLERVLWRSRLFIDGKENASYQESLVTPHRYFLTEGLSAGKHKIEIIVDNHRQHDISFNNLAHAYTNDTQVMWNGILGKMQLRALPSVEISRVEVYPDVENKKVRVVTLLKKEEKGNLSGELSLNIPSLKIVSNVQKLNISQDNVTVESVLSVGNDFELWSEFNPKLYNLDVTFKGKKVYSLKSVTFGMRRIDNRDGVLNINGNRIFLRGTLECCIFPLKGTPPTSEKEWEKVFTTAKSWGLNHLRFHSWCPPEAAFAVADKMGFYLQVELPLWSLRVGKDNATNRFLYKEFDNIIENYGNHPSFCLLSVGNELQPDFDLLNNFVAYMKERDSRHLYTTTTFTFEKGHGDNPEPQDQFFVSQWTDKGWIRGQGVFDSETPSFNKDYTKAACGYGVPVISHEIGQYAVYPNLKEISKYTGTLDPLNFKAIRDDLTNKGLIDKAETYLKVTGKLAFRLYKEEIERAMKTPCFSGFQLLGLQDFSGQGTALVGLVDAFWDNKGIVKEEEFRQFCSPVVPLARFEKAVYSGDEIFQAEIDIANFSDKSLDNHVLWRLKDDKDNIVTQGRFSDILLPCGKTTGLGRISYDLNKIKEAEKLTLDVIVENSEWKNSWSIWVYPKVDTINYGNVVVTKNIEEAKKALAKGKKVLYSPDSAQVKGIEGKFVPVFWSPVHFPKQAGTMGLLCHDMHPALKGFPTDDSTDWQWWNLTKQSKVIVTDSIESQIEPIVEVVDNFTNNRRLSTLFQARCNCGKIVVCSMDILSNCRNRPEVRQLLISLLKYMNSDEFNPEREIKISSLNSFTQ